MTIDCAPKLGCVTVTYLPDVELLQLQLQSLPAGAIRVLVDNGTPRTLWERVEVMLQRFSDVQVMRFSENLGLAVATNRGVEHLVATQGVTHVLLLDQDSTPTPDSVSVLLDSYQKLASVGERVGAVGPRLVDPGTGLSHGFHRIEGWRWRRSEGCAGRPLECAGLNGSGTLMKAEDFLSVGGLREDFFIDHIDTEYSFRLTAMGYNLFGVRDAVFLHRMGDSGKRLWLGKWSVWPKRTPLRHRYLFRNAMLLMRLPFVPNLWKLWAIPKLLLTVLVFGITGPDRLGQLTSMFRGVRDGLAGRKGQIG